MRIELPDLDDAERLARDKHKTAIRLATEAADRELESDLNSIALLRSGQFADAVKIVHALAPATESHIVTDQVLPSGKNGQDHATSEPPETSEADTSWAGLRNAIRSAARASPERLTLIDVMDYLAKHYPDQTGSVKRRNVSDELYRLCEREEIEVIERGEGNRPNTYRLAGNGSVTGGNN